MLHIQHFPRRIGRLNLSLSRDTARKPSETKRMDNEPNAVYGRTTSGVKSGHHKQEHSSDESKELITKDLEQVSVTILRSTNVHHVCARFLTFQLGYPLRRSKQTEAAIKETANNSNERRSVDKKRWTHTMDDDLLAMITTRCHGNLSGGARILIH
jgi:hypothetical protein